MDIFCCYLELFALILFFSLVLHIDFNKKKLHLIIAGILGLLLGIYTKNTLVPFPNTIFIAGIILLIFQKTILVKLAWFFIYELMESILANLLVFVISLLVSYDATPLYWGADIICYCFSFIICIMLKNTTQKNRFPYNLQKKDYLLLIFTALTDFLLSMLTSVFLFYPISTTGRRLLVLFIFLMICMTLLILFLYFKLQHYHLALQQTADLNQKALKLEELHYVELQQKNEDLRAFRHDYNHHLLAMQELANQQDYTGLTKYIKSLSQVREQTYYLSTNHTVADAIVNYFYERLPQQVQFQLLGKFSKPFFVEESDLCTLLSNLLKNAVEAVQLLSDRQEQDAFVKPTILLEIASDTDHVQIMLENSSIPYSPQEMEHLNTTKADTLNHGFGLRNVKEVVKKYHGTIDMQWENGLFSTCIFLAT